MVQITTKLKISLGIPDVRWPAFIIMMTAHVLVMNRHQVTSNHHADLTVTFQ